MPPKKGKPVEVVEEVVVPAYIKDCERLISIVITGKFEKGTHDFSEFDAGARDVSSSIPSPVKTGGQAGKGRVGTPTLTKQSKGRSATPNKGMKETPSSSEGAHTHHPPFAFTVSKPFFSLVVPGLEVVGTTPEVVAEGDLSVETPVNPIRALPTPGTVSEDGSFRIEMYRKNLTVCPLSVDAMLAHPFQFGFHSVPEISAAQRQLIASVDDASQSKGGAGKQGSKKNPNAGAQLSESDLKAAQDAIAATSPLTIPLLESRTLLSHSFDLSHVFRDSNEDCIELVDSEESPQSLSTTKLRRSRLHCSVGIPGLVKLSISILCSEPLLSPTNLARYLPMIIDVCEVDGLPSLQRDTVDLRHTMNPRVDELQLTTTHHKQSSMYGGYDVDAYHRLGGPKFASVRVKYNLVGGIEVSTQEVPHARTVSFNHRKIVFLYKYTAVEMFEFFFFNGIDLRVHDRDPVAVKPTGKSTALALGYGIAEVPLRTAVDGETRFVINHQIVPRRDLGDGAAYGADYISNSTTVKAKVTLLHRLPKCAYTVPKSIVTPFPEGLLGAKRHLSRALFVMPYRSENTQLLLQALMGTLIGFVKASGTTSSIVAVPPATLRVEGADVSPESRLGSAKEAQSKSKPPKDGSKKGSKKGVGKGDGATEGSAVATSQDEVMRAMLEHLPPALDTTTFLVPEGVSGFEVMDGEQRIVCIEGYVHIVHTLVTKVASVLGESADTDSSIRVLINTDLQFPQRWYHDWPPLVKPMPELFKAYGTKAIDEPPPEAVHDPTPQLTPRPPAKKDKGKAPAKPSKKGRGAQAESEKEVLTSTAVEPKVEATEPERQRHQSNRNELDAGGVGGRIRRIKLSQTVSTLVRQQRNFLKRNLSTETLRCVQKLSSLRKSTTMINAVDHDFFPTPAELVALERVCGDTLGVFDICGSDRYYAFGEGMADQAVEEANIQQIETIHRRMLKRPPSTAEVLEQGISTSHIGRVLSFIATPSTVDQRAKGKVMKLSADEFPRYKQKTYMVLDREATCKHTGENAEEDAPPSPPLLLCCFSSPPPTQLLRYLVIAQVVGAYRRAGDAELTPVLFVLRFETVAKNCSDNRNPEYEDHLKREARRAHPSEYNRIMAQKKAHYDATHSDGNVRRPCRADDSDEEDQDGFVDPPPYIPDEDTGREDDGGIESVLVRNDYVTLNKNVTGTLERWNKPVASVDAPDPQSNDRLWDLYNSQTRRMERIDTMVAEGRAQHEAPFRYGRPDRVEAQSSSSSDLDQSETKLPALPQSGREQKPMKFAGAANVLAQSSVVNDRSGQLTAAAEESERLKKKEAEKNLWRAKVVVDNLHFSVHNRSTERPVDSVARLRGMLEDPPMKKSIKNTYVAPPPVSIREAEKVKPNPRVEPTVVKHPEERGFYYGGPSPKGERKSQPISDEEKQSSRQLWGGV